MRRILNLHFVIIQMGIGAIAMLLPSIHALTLRDWEVARAFFYSAFLFGFLTALLALANYNSRSSNLSRSHLLASFPMM